MTDISEKSLAEIVTLHHQTATVFEKHNLDFCCKGRRTLQEACGEKGLSLTSILEEINNISTAKKEIRINDMDAEQLVNYIIFYHHDYIRQSIPVILNHANKVAQSHGDRYPYMTKVCTLFNILAEEMTSHIKKEEAILFPRIKEIYDLHKQKSNSDNYAVSYLQMLIDAMEHEHETAGELLAEIRQLTNDYTIPENACTTFKVCLAELKEFEEDLHKHVHLENYTLFPMAIKLASELAE